MREPISSSILHYSCGRGCPSARSPPQPPQRTSLLSIDPSTTSRDTSWTAPSIRTPKASILLIVTQAYPAMLSCGLAPVRLNDNEPANGFTGHKLFTDAGMGRCKPCETGVGEGPNKDVVWSCWGCEQPGVHN